MKFKTFLLGSAAVMAVTGAQAADLSVAEPVDYVRVCDAFGAGYWYIPGSDTCIKLGGEVSAKAAFHSENVVLNGYAAGITGGYTFSTTDGATGGGSGTFNYDDHHRASWAMSTSAKVNFTAKSMTEYGVLTGFVEIGGDSNNATRGDRDSVLVIDSSTGGEPAYLWGFYGHSTTQSDNDRYAFVKEAYLSLGPFLAGHTGSLFDYGGGFSGGAFHSDKKTDQVRLSWAMNGFGLALSIEDPRDRWGTTLAASYTLPDVIGAITFDQANFDAKLSGGVVQTGLGTGFGVQAGVTFKLDSIAPGDQFRLKGAWANNADSFVNSALSAGAGGASWSGLASFEHFWTASVKQGFTGSYQNIAGVGQWAVSTDIVWIAASGFELAGELIYNNVIQSGQTGNFQASVSAKRTW